VPDVVDAVEAEIGHITNDLASGIARRTVKAIA
jgi:hypothetical protein